MSLGSLAVVEEWLDADNRGDRQRIEARSAEDVEIVGPRGSVRGRQVLSEWMIRADSPRKRCAGSSAPTGACGRAGRAARVTRYARHDDVGLALDAAGLDFSDQVTARGAADRRAISMSARAAWQGVGEGDPP
jgi:hypothetical protein